MFKDIYNSVTIQLVLFWN